MSAKTFLENLNLDDNDVKNLVEAVFMANLIGDEQEEGTQKEVVLGWKSLLLKVLEAAAASKEYGDQDAETILDEELNESEDLENILTTNRVQVFWEELTSHIVGQEIEAQKIDLSDSEKIDALYKATEKSVSEKGLNVLKGENED